MAAGQYALRLAQLGWESTAGTAVAATQKLVGRAMFTPIIDRVQEDAPRGVRVPIDEDYIQWQGSELTFEGNLTYEDILYPLQTGIAEDAAPTGAGPTGAGPYVWTFTNAIAPTVKSLTGEFVIDDGSTKHYQREFTYLTCREFGISIAGNELAQMSFTMFGRAEQTSTVTGSLTPIAGRAAIPSNLFTLAIDDTWANLGNTAKTGTLRAASLDVVTGLEPDYTLDGRTDFDMTGLQLKQLTGTLSLTFEHNAIAATEIGNWRTGTARAFRLRADNGAATTLNRVINIDCYARITGFEVSNEDNIEIVTLTAELVYEATAAKALEIAVTNGLSADV